METATTEKPIRVGIFSTISQADQAIAGLLNAGFKKDQISVICSNRAKEDHFREYEHQQPAGSRTPIATAAGSAIGALGGLTVLAGLLTTQGVGVLAAGGIIASTGALVGGFIGAMMTRGIDKEVANYYDQAVTQGKILVAAEDHTDNQKQSLAKAERILAEAGADPVELAEG